MKGFYYNEQVYAGFLVDNQLLLKCSSGGIATALAKKFVLSGGYVAGVVYSKDFRRAEYKITNKVEELDGFRGSKYVEVDKDGVYHKVQQLLEQGKNVLFFGLPCVVAAMERLSGIYRDRLVLCELVCHGVTLPQVHEEYVAYLEEKYNSNLVDFSVRYKKRNWVPPYLRATFSNGVIFEKEFYQTEYGKAFLCMARESCYHCKFKGKNRRGDIMLGDFWGATKKDIFWNEKGVSVIFAETEKGNNLIKQLDEIAIFPVSFKRAVEQNRMVIEARKRDKKSDRFVQYFQNEGLFVAVKKTTSFSDKIKNMIPYRFKAFLKKIV